MSTTQKQTIEGINAALESLRSTMEAEGHFVPEFIAKVHARDEQTRLEDLAQRHAQETHLTEPKAKAAAFTADWESMTRQFPLTATSTAFDKNRTATALAGVVARHLDVETDSNIRSIAAALRGVRQGEARKEIALLIRELAHDAHGIASPVAVLRKRLEAAKGTAA